LGVISSPHALEAKPSKQSQLCTTLLRGRRTQKIYKNKKIKNKKEEEERNGVEKERKKILSGVCEMCRPRGEEKREEKKRRKGTMLTSRL
jgi:hypothetical protein